MTTNNANRQGYVWNPATSRWEPGGDMTTLLAAIAGIGAQVPYDQITLSYTGDNVTGVVYKSAGVTVATLTMSYTGSNLTGVVRS